MILAKAGRESVFTRAWRHRSFYMFISPFFIMFAVFGLYPLVFSLGLSFARWDGLTDLKWVGFGNFALMRTDDLFLVALKNTARSYSPIC